MTIDRLQQALEASPFRPFRMRMADGSVVPIPNPMRVGIAPPGRTVIVVYPNGDWDAIDLLMVTKLEFRRRGRRGRNGNGSPEA